MTRGGVPLAPRLLRLARTGSPGAVARAATRVARVRAAEATLDRAARTDAPLLVGPWLGEVGYELLYWIPFLRRELGRRRIDPGRVTVLTRGGADLWYGGIAHRSVELFDLVAPEELRERVARRERAVGDLKQLTVEALDRELVAAARARGAEGALVHPLLMFSRLRWFWNGARPLAGLAAETEPGPLRLRGGEEREPGLPERYVALKAYFSHSLPDAEPARSFLRELVARLAERHELVLLEAGARVDDHDAWLPEERVHRVAVPVRRNLAAQTRVVAGADALVATYGGFSYLGPLLGVPTLALRSAPSDVALHREVLGLAVPGARYAEADAREPGALAAALAALP